MMLPHLSISQWILALLAAMSIGMSKTGIAGLGMLSVTVFAITFPSRASVGLVLPLLIMGDFFAVTAYKAHAKWDHLWRLFPWAGLGILLGFLVMHRIDNRQTQILIGLMLLLMVVLHLWRKSRGNNAVAGNSFWYAAFIGVFAGFSTMTANAAGPLMVLYLLMMGLPKMEFMGTSAWFFFAINLFKVPFAANLGLFTQDSLSINLILAPAVIIGTVVGKWLLHRIDQNMFEKLTLVLTILGAIKMLLPS